MPLQFSPEDADTLAQLPDRVRMDIIADLEAQAHARYLAAVNAAAKEHAEASRAGHPITRQIAAMNAQAAAHRPPARPSQRPQPPAPTAPPLATRTIAQHNQVVATHELATAIERARLLQRPTLPLPTKR